MTGLESWLKQATRSLSRESAARVRSEIHEHYESAREAAMTRGAEADEADRSAVAALGDARTANRQYRKVLLTSAEAKMLAESNWEARAVCSRPWLKWMLLAITAGALVAGAVLLATGPIQLARLALACGLAMGIFVAAPFLPIYTASRARAFRGVKWVALMGVCMLALWEQPWLMASCLWPLAWIELTRISIRRKLPVAQWPRQLYL